MTLLAIYCLIFPGLLGCKEAGPMNTSEILPELVSVRGTVTEVKAERSNGVGQAVIYFPGLAEVADNRKQPFPVVTITLEKGQAFPSSACVQVSQRLIIKGNGEDAHSVSVASRNLGYSGLTHHRENETILTFNKPENDVQVACDLHPNELVWISVLPNACYAKASSAGAYFISYRLPVGQHKVCCFHKDYGLLEKMVQVKEKVGVLTVDFVYPVDDKSK